MGGKAKMHPCGLHFIIGKKGGGKSMLAVKMILKILVETRRTIVTNLPLHLGEMKAYLREHFPNFKDDLNKRITIIPEARILKRFWLTLGQDWWIPDVSKEAWAMGQRLDYRTAYRWLPTTGSTRHRKPITDLTMSEISRYCEGDELTGVKPEMEQCLVEDLPQVQFVIDELQNIFAARNFLQTSPGALFWLSQQRHLGADFIAITQNLDLVDKEFRDLADDFLHLVNWGRKRKSFFRLPSVITWAKYDTKPAPGVKAMLTGMLRVDVNGLGQLYDTSAGVGIEGGLSADKSEKVKGLHWLWFVGLIIFLGFLLIQTPGCVHGVVMRALSLKPKSDVLQSITKTNAVPSAGAPASLPREINNLNLPKNPEDRTNLTGLTVGSRKMTVWFRNGSSCDTDDRRRFECPLVIGKKVVGARIQGTNYYLPD